MKNNILIPHEESIEGTHLWPKSKNKYVRACLRCGLVPIGNRITDICVSAGCGYRNNSQYKAWVDKGCKF